MTEVEEKDCIQKQILHGDTKTRQMVSKPVAAFVRFMGRYRKKRLIAEKIDEKRQYCTKYGGVLSAKSKLFFLLKNGKLIINNL